MDEQPTGSCPCCRRRDPREGFACGPCRSKLRSWLGEIPDLWQQLLAEEPEVRDVRVVRLREDGTEETVHYDHVANVFPAGPSSYPSRSGPVSGSPERRLPIDTDRIDLTSPGGWPEQLDEDQIGHIPVWMTLQTWARDWSTFRAMGEAGDQTVPGLCHWMWERVDDMCDEHEAIDEAFQDIRRLYGTLYAQLGLFEKPDYKYGVPCRQCNALALVRHNGSDFVECGECPAVLTPAEFDTWVRGVAAAAKKMEKAA
jgi:hypothetical protein